MIFDNINEKILEEQEILRNQKIAALKRNSMKERNINYNDILQMNKKN